MAKKKKTGKPMSVHDRLALHMSVSEQLTTLISRCKHMHETGKTAEAQRLFKRIERLAEDLKRLEK